MAWKAIPYRGWRDHDSFTKYLESSSAVGSAISLYRILPVGALALLASLALPNSAAAEAMVRACNEMQTPASLSMRVYGFAWERETLRPGECRQMRVSGFNLIFDVATIWHGAKLRLEPEAGPAMGACEWKIDFAAAGWQHHAIRGEPKGVVCVFRPVVEGGETGR